LIAGVAGAAGGDVGQVDVGLVTGALDDGPQPEIAVRLKSSRVVRERRETADRRVHTSVVIIIQYLAVGIGNTRQPAVVLAAGRAAETVDSVGRTRLPGGQLHDAD